MEKQKYIDDMRNALKEIQSDCFLLRFNDEDGTESYSVCSECPFCKVCDALQEVFDDYDNAERDLMRLTNR